MATLSPTPGIYVDVSGAPAGPAPLPVERVTGAGYIERASEGVVGSVPSGWNRSPGGVDYGIHLRSRGTMSAVVEAVDRAIDQGLADVMPAYVRVSDLKRMLARRWLEDEPASLPPAPLIPTVEDLARAAFETDERVLAVVSRVVGGEGGAISREEALERAWARDERGVRTEATARATAQHGALAGVVRRVVLERAVKVASEALHEQLATRAGPRTGVVTIVIGKKGTVTHEDEQRVVDAIGRAVGVGSPFEACGAETTLGRMTYQCVRQRGHESSGHSHLSGDGTVGWTKDERAKAPPVARLGDFVTTGGAPSLPNDPPLVCCVAGCEQPREWGSPCCRSHPPKDASGGRVPALDLAREECASAGHPLVDRYRGARYCACRYRATSSETAK